MTLSDAQIDLYSRQIILREVGGVGQRKLLAARCLVLGDGAASEAAATYLAGAGVGRLEVRGTDGRPRQLAALPPLETRNPDTQLTLASGAEPAGAERHDVVLVFASEPAAFDACQAYARGTPDMPRLGATLVRTAGEAVELLLLPSAVSCLACGAPPAANPGAGRAPDASALGAAGALAALACCRWLLGLDPAPTPRAFRIAPPDLVWLPHEPARAARCPRGCS